jgi:AraC-like DNA-binding protein
LHKSQTCGPSRGYFIRGFKKTTGKAPHQWILSQRVERARGLLMKTDMSLADVALACGFADQSHFTRVSPVRPDCRPARGVVRLFKVDPKHQDFSGREIARATRFVDGPLSCLPTLSVAVANAHFRASFSGSKLDIRGCAEH